LEAYNNNKIKKHFCENSFFHFFQLLLLLLFSYLALSPQQIFLTKCELKKVFILIYYQMCFESSTYPIMIEGRGIMFFAFTEAARAFVFVENVWRKFAAFGNATIIAQHCYLIK
jgi:hypothetical protein